MFPLRGRSQGRSSQCQWRAYGTKPGDPKHPAKAVFGTWIDKLKEPRFWKTEKIRIWFSVIAVIRVIFSFSQDLGVLLYYKGVMISALRIAVGHSFIFICSTNIDYSLLARHWGWMMRKAWFLTSGSLQWVEELH